MALQVVLLLLVPYALPLLIPSWRGLLAYALAVALLIAVWAALWYYTVAMAPTRTGLEGIGLAFGLVAAISTAVGTIVRMVTLIVRARFFVATINIVSAALLVAAVLVWANR